MINYQKKSIDKEKLKTLFLGDEGYQTPKIDTRAAIFKEDKNSISFLLVRDVPTDNAREKVSIDKETAINIIDNIFILQLYYFEYLFMISFA